MHPDATFYEMDLQNECDAVAELLNQVDNSHCDLTALADGSVILSLAETIPPDTGRSTLANVASTLECWLDTLKGGH